LRRKIYPKFFRRKWNFIKSVPDEEDCRDAGEQDVGVPASTVHLLVLAGRPENRLTVSQSDDF
jgi:hypothetical protein